MALQFTRGTGGKFTGSIGGVPVPPSMAAVMSRMGASAGGPLSFNGRSGTGYGSKGGDPRVRLLQQALNRAGIGDSAGHSLAVDGKLGPLTTSAVKAAQKQLGVKTDGVVTPKLLAQIMGLPKGSPKPAGKSSPGAKKTTTARAKFKAAAPKASPPKSPPKPAASAAATPDRQLGRVKYR